MSHVLPPRCLHSPHVSLGLRRIDQFRLASALIPIQVGATFGIQPPRLHPHCTVWHKFQTCNVMNEKHDYYLEPISARAKHDNYGSVEFLSKKARLGLRTCTSIN